MKELFSCAFDISKETPGSPSSPGADFKGNPFETRTPYIYDQLFGNNTTIPLPERKAINMKGRTCKNFSEVGDIAKIVSGSKNRGLLKLFEPLVVR
jgi:hypothetical protein